MNNFWNFSSILNLKYICCVVAKETKGNNTEQRFSHFLPVIPLEMLVHMKETALIIVVAPIDRHDEIRQNLSDLDFKKIIFLSDEIHELVKEALQKFSDSGHIVAWFRNHIMEELKEMDYLIAEQHSIAELHTKTFPDYRDCFYGKKVVLLADGATTKYYEPISDAIHVSVGSIQIKGSIQTEYHFLIENDDLDYESNMKYRPEEIKEKIFLGQCPARYNTADTNLIHSEDFHLERSGDISMFYFSPPMRYPGTIPLNVDICSHILTGLIDVTTFALHFALFTYPKELYLVGFDNVEEKYILDETDEFVVKLSMLSKIKVMFARIKMFARCHYPHTKIISVNPIGLKGLFDDVYTRRDSEYLS